MTSLLLLGASAGAAHALQALPVTVTGSTAWTVANSLPPTGPSTTFSLGTKPLVPVIGDWDGNGTRTPGTFEAGVFKLSDALPPGGPPINIPFGDPRGFPLAGDFNGDGRDDLAVYRNGLWQLRVESGGTGSGGAVVPSDLRAYAGNWPGTIPVAGDWDGDGVDGIGRFTPLTGEWLLRQTTTGLDLPTFTYNPGVSPYAVVGDWDNDGDDTVGVKAGTSWLLNNQNDSSPPDDTFAFGLANDLPLVGGGTASVNTAPIVQTTAANLNYAENAGPVAADNGVTVTDPGSATLQSATVAITSNFVSAQDELAFADQLGITGSYNDATGVLTLTGPASVASFQTALRAVTYENVSNDPNPLSRQLTFIANDGSLSSAPATRTISITAANDAPVVTTSGGSAAFTVDGSPVVVDSGLSVTDPDSPQLSGATVSISANATAGDALSFTPQGSITGVGAGTSTLTLSGAGTPAQYQAVLRSVTYEGSASTPATRTISFRVTDNAGANSNIATRGVTVAAADNSAPVVLTSGGSTAYVEGAAPVAVDGGLIVVDSDDANLVSAQARISAGFEPGDVLTFTPSGGAGGAGSSYNAGTGVLTLIGPGPVASFQTVLRSVRFNSTNENPAASRTIEFKVNDGDVDSNLATKTIAVTRVNDAPVITTTAANLIYTENAGPVVVDSGVTVTDADSAFISSATVTIQAPSFNSGQDTLALPMNPQFTTTFSGGVLTLTAVGGSVTVSDLQAALRTVTYTNSSEGPTPPTRTIAFQATDDAAAAGNVATRTINITSLNDPPTAVNDVGSTDEDTQLTFTAPGVLANDTDLDPGDTKTVVRLNGLLTLTDSTAEGGSVTINANGSYTYTPPAAFQTLSTGESDTDSFQYTMRDDANAESSATVNLTVHGVSDAPTAVADTFEAVGNTGLFVGTTRPATQAGKVITGSILTNDTDPDSPHANLVAEPVTNAPTTLGGTITIEADGNFTYHPDDGDTGPTDTFTYRVCDSAPSPCNSGTIANATGTINLVLSGQVWYVRNSQADGGDGTSDTPFDTLTEAETASGTGDTVYVFDGNNTTTNLNTGYVMNASERLIGESRPLSLDPDGGGALPTSSLFPGTSGAQPMLTASNEDVIVLASDVLVDGIDVDPSGAGGGISGGAGTSDVTVQNASVTDTGTAGTQPGIEMDGTSGVNRFTGVTVSNGGSATAIGVRINNADRVLFAGTVTNPTSIATTGAKALDAASTNLLTSGWNDITVTGSGTGAIRLNNTTGSPDLGDGVGTDLLLQTTSGTTAALDISSSNNVTVDGGGAATISATGGPAADIRNSNGSTYDFDTVSSTGSAGLGVNLQTLLGTTFSAIGGTISGHTATGFFVSGGAGAISYGGDIADGAGNSAGVTVRTGGTVTFSGTLSDGPDNSGGVTVVNNSGGSTVFSGPAKTFSTGNALGVDLSTNTGHTVSFTNGGLDIDTTGAPAGFSAQAGGTVNVTGTANTIDTGTGRALRIDHVTIGDDDVTFQRIASNGAPNGILLDTTANANGKLVVAGNGGMCSSAASCTGGAIQNSTGAGISLTGVPGGASLTRMAVTGGGDDGIRATTVDDVDLADSVVTNNGNFHAAGDTGERGLEYLNVTGSPQILRTTVSGSDDSNAHIRNTVAGSTTLTVGASTFSGSKFNAGLRLRGEGPSVMNATVTGSVFSLNADPGFSMQTDSSNTAQQTLLFNNNDVSGGSSNAVSARPQISINVDSASIVKASLTNNQIKSAAGSEVILNTLEHHTGTFDVKFNSNSIGDAQPGDPDALADGGSSIHGWTHGDGLSRMEIRNNSVQNWGGRAMELSHNTGNGDADFTLTGNVLSNPDATANTFEGIYIFSGAGNVAGDTSDVCIDMENNDMDGIGRQSIGDIGFDRDTNSFLRFADFNGTDVGGLQASLRGKNPPSPALTVDQFGNPVTATAATTCDLPVGTP